MIIFKCLKCRKTQTASCLINSICKYCSGEIEVWDIEEEENV